MTYWSAWGKKEPPTSVKSQYQLLLTIDNNQIGSLQDYESILNATCINYSDYEFTDPI